MKSSKKSRVKSQNKREDTVQEYKIYIYIYGTYIPIINPDPAAASQDRNGRGANRVKILDCKSSLMQIIEPLLSPLKISV